MSKKESTVGKVIGKLGQIADQAFDVVPALTGGSAEIIGAAASLATGPVKDAAADALGETTAGKVVSSSAMDTALKTTALVGTTAAGLALGADAVAIGVAAGAEAVALSAKVVKETLEAKELRELKEKNDQYVAHRDTKDRQAEIIAQHPEFAELSRKPQKSPLSQQRAPIKLSPLAEKFATEGDAARYKDNSIGDSAISTTLGVTAGLAGAALDPAEIPMTLAKGAVKVFNAVKESGEQGTGEGELEALRRANDQFKQQKDGPKSKDLDGLKEETRQAKLDTTALEELAKIQTQRIKNGEEPLKGEDLKKQFETSRTTAERQAPGLQHTERSTAQMIAEVAQHAVRDFVSGQAPHERVEPGKTSKEQEKADTADAKQPVDIPMMEKKAVEEAKIAIKAAEAAKTAEEKAIKAADRVQDIASSGDDVATRKAVIEARRINDEAVRTAKVAEEAKQKAEETKQKVAEAKQKAEEAKKAAVKAPAGPATPARESAATPRQSAPAIPTPQGKSAKESQEPASARQQVDSMRKSGFGSKGTSNVRQQPRAPQLRQRGPAQTRPHGSRLERM